MSDLSNEIVGELDIATKRENQPRCDLQVRWWLERATCLSYEML
jgi:hypothetical protein